MKQKSLTDRVRDRRSVAVAGKPSVAAEKGTVPSSPRQVSGQSPPHAQAGGAPSRLLTASIAGLLVLATLLVFAQTARHEFINYDDDLYVYENPRVQQGLTATTLAWAFTTFKSCNWHPLTWVSHALDYQLFGLWAGGHHLINLLLHCVNIALLFWLLSRATGRVWVSGLAAAVFAVHPLRVESVAWASERKDLLSAMFFLLCLAAYGNYAMKPFSARRYLAVATIFTLGLLCKPMLVTLPFVLVLVDYWPLNRWELPAGAGRAARRALAFRLLVEKAPLLLLSAISCGITVVAQRDALGDTDVFPVWERIANALVSYTAYLGQSLWPARLALAYPYSESSRGRVDVAVAATALLIVTLAVILARRKYPFLLVGWLWYLGMLIPVIGLVQVGQQALADRYTYLPLIGPVAAATLAAAVWVDRVPRRRRKLALLAAAGLTALAVSAWQQTTYWHDSRALWLRSINVTLDNYVAFYQLGHHMEQRGEYDAAVDEYRKALDIRPDWDAIHNQLGFVLTKQGKLPEALDHLLLAVSINPRNAHAKVNLGNALARTGKVDAAISQYRSALEIDSTLPEAWNDLGLAHAKLGRTGDAINDFHKSLEINPRYVDAHNNLGATLSGCGRMAEAVEQFQQVLQIDPQDPDALWNLGAVSFQQGDVAAALSAWRQVVRQQPKRAQKLERLAWVLATSPRADCRNGAEAVQLAERAAQLSGRNPAVLRTLAAAYAECGRFQEAIQTANEALAKLSAAGERPTSEALKREIELYRAAMPLRQPQ